MTLLKDQNQLDQMEDDDDDIECSNLISRYAERPNSLENVTLAEFASYYEKVDQNKSKTYTFTKSSLNQFLPEPHLTENEDDIDNTDDSHDKDVKQRKEQNHHVEYRRKARENILRSVHFNPNIASEKYYRELVMLYYPWRVEETLRQNHE